MDGWMVRWTETVIIELTQSSLAGTRLSLATIKLSVYKSTRICKLQVDKKIGNDTYFVHSGKPAYAQRGFPSMQDCK